MPGNRDIAGLPVRGVVSQLRALFKGSYSGWDAMSSEQALFVNIWWSSRERGR